MPTKRNLHEKLADKITAHQITLERLKAGEKQSVIAMLRDLEKSLILELEKLDVTGAASRYHQARLAKLLQFAKETIRGSYRGIRDDQREALQGLAKLEDSFVRRAVNGTIGVDLMTVTLSAETLKTLASDTLIMKAPSAEWWSRQAGDTLQRFTDNMRDGVLRGEPTTELVRRVRGRRENQFADGIMQTSYRNAEALVRTSVQTVANEARLETYAANADVINGTQWVSTLDRRTTKICIALDGKVWDRELKPIGHKHKFPGPTAHWGCRSTQIPVMKTFQELAGAKETRSLVEQATEQRKDMLRASMDGQVAGVQTFDEFLKRKDGKYQDQLLGRERAKLWRDGKITADDLTNQDNRPLTVKQLQKLAERRTGGG
jgi:SPP1 gp7 family putative phage head morphogenesis protein